MANAFEIEYRDSRVGTQAYLRATRPALGIKAGDSVASVYLNDERRADDPRQALLHELLTALNSLAMIEEAPDV
jgi:hypothetical protein